MHSIGSRQARFFEQAIGKRQKLGSCEAAFSPARECGLEGVHRECGERQDFVFAKLKAASEFGVVHSDNLTNAAIARNSCAVCAARAAATCGCNNNAWAIAA